MEPIKTLFDAALKTEDLSIQMEEVLSALQLFSRTLDNDHHYTEESSNVWLSVNFVRNFSLYSATFHVLFRELNRMYEMCPHKEKAAPEAGTFESGTGKTSTNILAQTGPEVKRQAMKGKIVFVPVRKNRQRGAKACHEL